MDTAQIRARQALLRRQKTKRDFGLVRVATAVPQVRVGDVRYNVKRIIRMMAQAQKREVDVLFFPELCITAYTAADLLKHQTLLDGAMAGLAKVVEASKSFDGVVEVGLPIEVGCCLYNCAVAIKGGRILGAVPKAYIPNYGEFYEGRWFSPEGVPHPATIILCGQVVPFGNDLLFAAEDCPELVLFLEICEDLWVTIPPSSLGSLAGATLLGNASASNALVGKADFRRKLVLHQSSACMAVYAYASAGTGESTTDVAFDGHQMIAENGAMLKENERFELVDTMLVADVDLQRCKYERLTNKSFAENKRKFEPMIKDFRTVTFRLGRVTKPSIFGQKPEVLPLERFVDPHPFVPKANGELNARCAEIYNITVAGLCKRLTSVARRMKVKELKVTIGISGGLDSTLALLKLCKAYDRLGWSRKNIIGYTMPGYGTTGRTKGNAHSIMRLLGITSREVDIRGMCYEQWLKENYKPFGIDLHELMAEVQAAYFTNLRKQLAAELASGTPMEECTLPGSVDFTALAVEELSKRLANLEGDLQDLHFENTQARFRTKVLMDNGFVIGTGDLSELAIGWCTYNGDHMSMYNPNCSIPKTLVKFLVAWAAENLFSGETQEVLRNIVQTKVSPELLPTGKDGELKQVTEETVGPYELHDFFMYYLLRYGMSPEKILFLANHAKFDGGYDAETIEKWLITFLTRFFTAQFKRSCAPDGTKVGSCSVSPRGDLRMASDTEATLWLEWYDPFVDDGDWEDENPNKGGLMTDSTTNDTTAGAATEGKDLVKLAIDAGVTEQSIKLSACFKLSALPEDLGADENRALLLVDAIKAFMGKKAGGELPVEGGEDIGKPIGELQRSKRFKKRAAGNDKHKKNMFNLRSNAPAGAKTVKDKDGIETSVWDDHAIEGTQGVEFIPGVDESLIDEIFPKGDDPNKDSNSACGNVNLIPRLREWGITHVDLVGLVFRICVGMTAIDLVKAGFKVRVIVDCTRDLEIPEFEWVIEQMVILGVEFVTKDQVLASK